MTERTPLIILNLGCGTRTSDVPGVVNIDWSPYLRLAQSPMLMRIVPLFLDAERRARLLAIPSNVKVYDLRKGLPYRSNSIDVVYHSHVLEHLDRDVAPGFQKEIRRVLKPHGIQRIVVPDLARLCQNIVADISQQRRTADPRHDDLVGVLLEQCVRREAYGTSRQGSVRRAVENVVLGDARRRGETHQWMYDALNLQELLEECGFHEIMEVGFSTSKVPKWRSYLLDEDAEGKEYKPGSLYMEATW